MKFDNITNRIINDAYIFANESKHEYFIPEHILYSMISFDTSRSILENLGFDTMLLEKDLNKYFSSLELKTDNVQPIESEGLKKIFKKIHSNLDDGEKKIRFTNIFMEIYNDETLNGSFYLKKQNLDNVNLTNLNDIFDSEEELLKQFYFNDNSVEDEESGLIYEDDEFEYYNLNRKKNENFDINNFLLDYSKMAENKEFDPIIGRDEIINKTIQTLCRRVKNNPIHVGEPGVGKTAITEGIATMIAEGNVPSKLKDSRIYSLSMATLIGGTKYRGDFENRIKIILDTLEVNGNAIVYIDEIHTIIGAGSNGSSALDASNIIKPYLTKGKIKFIGSTTYDEYKKYFQKDRTLSRRFQKIDVPEPTIEESIKIIKGLKKVYESFHNVTYDDSAINAACNLSVKYINDKFLPDKAIDLIDEAGAYTRIQSNNNKKIKINNKVIEKVISTIVKIPETTIMQSELSFLKDLEAKLNEYIFGQEDAIKKVVNAIKISRSGLLDREKPVANFIFIGATGVGKTELSKSLANIMNIPLIRFDMSEYQEKHAVARLIGAPPGYVGYEEGGLLIDSVKKNPYAVLLLDEIEKAHSDIYNVLLQIMDYATLTDTNGRKADFKNIILIMTSNVGTRDIKKTPLGFGSTYNKEENISDEFNKVFSPEFRNRLDNIIVFNNLNEITVNNIVKKIMKEFELILKSKKINLTVNNSIYEYILKKSLLSEYGAREIHRIIHNEIKSKLVDEILFGELVNGGCLELNIVNEKINFLYKGKIK